MNPTNGPSIPSRKSEKIVISMTHSLFFIIVSDLLSKILLNKYFIKVIVEHYLVKQPTLNFCFSQITTILNYFQIIFSSSYFSNDSFVSKLISSRFFIKLQLVRFTFFCINNKNTILIKLVSSILRHTILDNRFQR